MGGNGNKEERRSYCMRDKKMNIILIVIHDENGFDMQEYDRLDRLIRSRKPDFHEFVGDHSFHIAFKNNIKNSYKAEMFVKELEKLVRDNPRFTGVKIGRQAGECLCRVDAFGRLTSIPMGIVACQAMKAAVS
jgi:hypothetical protein